jgi:hypothetical protein
VDASLVVFIYWCDRKIFDAEVEYEKSTQVVVCTKIALLLDAVLESVMVFRLAAGAVTEVVVPLGLAKAGTYIVGSKAFGDSPCNGIFPRL